MKLKDALFSWLTADADVVGIVGSRVFPDMVPQDESLPAITYHLIDSQDAGRLKGGRMQYLISRFQIDLWAETAEEREALALAVIGKHDDPKLDRLCGSIGSGASEVWLQGTRIELEMDLYEDPEDAADVGTYRRMIQIVISWNEP